MKIADIDRPLVSIVTPNWNGAAFIDETIRSVISQSYDRIEYIIIDGDSTDGSVEIIMRHRDLLAYWVSEPDAGMYDAVNKGMARATGEIVAYLNSDDLYCPEAISTVVAIFAANPEVDLIYGDLDYINRNGARLFSQRFPRFNLQCFANASFSMIGQPAAFWRRVLFQKTGYFDASMKMAADFDFFIRAGIVGRLMHVNHVFAAFRVHAESMSSSQTALNTEEVSRIHAAYLEKAVPRNGRLALSCALLYRLLNWRAFLAKKLTRSKRYSKTPLGN